MVTPRHEARRGVFLNPGARPVEAGHGGSRVTRADRVLVRDTKDRSGPVLRFSPAAWRRFADQVRTGVADSDTRS